MVFKFGQLGVNLLLVTHILLVGIHLNEATAYVVFVTVM